MDFNAANNGKDDDGGPCPDPRGNEHLLGEILHRELETVEAEEQADGEHDSGKRALTPGMGSHRNTDEGGDDADDGMVSLWWRSTFSEVILL